MFSEISRFLTNEFDQKNLRKVFGKKFLNFFTFQQDLHYENRSWCSRREYTFDDILTCRTFIKKYMKLFSNHERISFFSKFAESLKKQLKKEVRKSKSKKREDMMCALFRLKSIEIDDSKKCPLTCSSLQEDEPYESFYVDILTKIGGQS